MAIRDLYSTKEKEKPLYSNSNTANVRMQSTPQNSAWDTGQSAAPLQIDTIRKSKREKSPSELGEEVLRLMLEGEMPQVQQPAAATTPAAEPKAKAAVGEKSGAI